MNIAKEFVKSHLENVGKPIKGPWHEAKAEMTRAQEQLALVKTEVDTVLKRVEEKKEREAASLIMISISEKVEESRGALKQLQGLEAPLEAANESDMKAFAETADVAVKNMNIAKEFVKSHV